MENKKCAKTDKLMFITSEYIFIGEDWTVTSDKQGKSSFQYSKVEECIKL